ncbi:L-lactate dehydrogenase [Ornithinimicrobium tianjinense]|uniref:L-lactate dehydrogenase n=1 Tax=Ornithinimicrobium tianjinense TaxID=1195761 RepID=A0A917BNT9_9MICO|nr:L-lactate dehydrogenase [Ornithinimicrobium tianjinense]GGF53163.1 L-lactate dehydrogenase [Ornithinimicrobium tianjinense]
MTELHAPARPDVAVVGAGSVGATIAYAALVRGSVRRVVLHDIDSAKLEAEVLDISHGLSFTPMGSVEGSDDVEICRGARVVVVTAGAKQKPGQSRMDLAASTVGLMRSIMPRLVEVAPDATYVMVTNPVDVVTTAALRLTGLPPQQLFGSGTVLDSSRLRHAVASRIGVAVQNVHAYVVGEHGDTEFPLWSSASVGGVPLREWSRTHGGALDGQALAEITDDVVHAAYRIIAGKGATNYAVALACCQIVESVLRDERRVLPVSTLLDGDYGLRDVCLSVPTVVGAGGALERLVVPMSADELELLHRSAHSIRTAVQQVGV